MKLRGRSSMSSFWSKLSKESQIDEEKERGRGRGKIKRHMKEI